MHHFLACWSTVGWLLNVLWLYCFKKVILFAGYIKDFQVHDPHRVGSITVELLGRVNDCRALTYRQDLKAKEIEQYRLRILPTRQVYTFMLHKLFFLKRMRNTPLPCVVLDIAKRIQSNPR